MNVWFWMSSLAVRFILYELTSLPRLGEYLLLYCTRLNARSRNPCHMFTGGLSLSISMSNRVYVSVRYKRTCDARYLHGVHSVNHTHQCSHVTQTFADYCNEISGVTDFCKDNNNNNNNKSLYSPYVHQQRVGLAAIFCILQLELIRTECWNSNGGILRAAVVMQFVCGLALKRYINASSTSNLPCYPPAAKATLVCFYV